MRVAQEPPPRTERRNRRRQREGERRLLRGKGTDFVFEEGEARGGFERQRAGAQTLIAGIVLSDYVPKTLLIRAAPALA